MTRTPFIAGNWKMNLSVDEASNFAGILAQELPAGIDVAVFPPFPWIVPVKQALGESTVQVGAQNCHWEPSGAFTGEVSAAMLADVCDLILAGHSERRHVFGETDDVVAKKVPAILSAGVDPILCVGETLDERNADQASAVVERQLESGLAGVTATDIARLTIAYEPVWAIGTGVAATAQDAQEMCALARRWLTQRFGESGQDVRVLYGGSMTAENAHALLAQPDIDGGLVGGASLKADAFVAIVAAAAEQAQSV